VLGSLKTSRTCRIEADLGPGVRVRMGTFCIPSQAPLKDHPLGPRRAPLALEVWILEIIQRDPRGSRAFRGTFLQKGEVLAHVGLFQNLKDLKSRICRLSHRLHKPLTTQDSEPFIWTKTPVPWPDMNPKNRESLRLNRINNQAQFQILNQPTNDRAHTLGYAAINAGPVSSTSLRPDTVCLTETACHRLPDADCMTQIA
jgi:hypothetical protein